MAAAGYEDSQPLSVKQLISLLGSDGMQGHTEGYQVRCETIGEEGLVDKSVRA